MNPKDKLQKMGDIKEVIDRLVKLTTDNGEADTACSIARVQETLSTIRMGLLAWKSGIFIDVPAITVDLTNERNRLNHLASILGLAEQACEHAEGLIELAKQMCSDRFKELEYQAKEQANFTTVNT